MTDDRPVRNPGPPYQGYAHISEEQAAQEFERRYGSPPECVFRSGPVVLAGPIRAAAQGGDDATR